MEERDLAFDVDAPVGGDAYTCTTFDATSLQGRFVRSVRFTAPDADVVLHHASLLAVRERPVTTGAGCAWPLDAVTLATHVRGAPALALPAGIGIRFPDARFLVVQAHAQRRAAGAAITAHALLELTTARPERVAAWTSTAAPVPAIRPRSMETSTGACATATSFRILAAFPHMHRAGSSFRSEIVRPGGERSTVVDVATWDFDAPAASSVDAVVARGDVVTTTCTWLNGSDHYLLPGAGLDDEMCTQGLVVVADAAQIWTPPCP